jgi:predicted PP-loop superfamily ATPase
VLYKDVEISETKKVAGLRGKLNKVVLAYSGGLDTSVVVPWLRYIHIIFFVPFQIHTITFLFNLTIFDVYAERTMAVMLFASLLI